MSDAASPDDRRSGPTPVNLLTGFLGSGKTTLLQRMLADPSMAGCAVLINEFGEVGLDHHLLDRIDDNVVLLKSGCVCCTVRGEVADALQSLHARRGRGEIPWFDRVVIETTGMADPYPALSTIRSHPVLKSQFSIGNVVTTVDAVNAAGILGRRLEATRQIAAADVVALTKTDLCDDAQGRAVRESLARLNPTASVLAATDPALPGLVAARRTAEPEALVGVSPTEVEPAATHHHDHGDQDDGHAVKSFAMVFEDRVDWTGFGIWLTMLLHSHGDRIFRVKGMLHVSGEPNPVAVHAVQRLVHPPVHMSGWPDEGRRSTIVFITEGLDPDRIRHSFSVFNRLSARILGRSESDQAASSILRTDAAA